MVEKNVVTSRLNGKNYAAISGAGVDIIDAEAHFLSNKVIEITAGDEKEELTASVSIIIRDLFQCPANSGLTGRARIYFNWHQI